MLQNIGGVLGIKYLTEQFFIKKNIKSIVISKRHICEISSYVFIFFVLFFFLFDSLHPINNLSVKQSRVSLGLTSNKLG